MINKKWVTPSRYLEGQIFCGTCQVWLWTNVWLEEAKKRGVSIPPEFAIYTHKKIMNAGKVTFEPNGDPYAGISCDCCNSKTSVRAVAGHYGRTPQLQAAVAAVGTFDDTKLLLPSTATMDQAINGIQDQILIDDDTIVQIVASLVSGKNLLLIGAVGTGKTH